jgi:dTDP-4-amino-4,6-dideoxygalactose transaminase
MTNPDKMISWWRTSLGEEEIHSISTSILNENISQGEVTAEFERNISEILSVPYVVATTSGSMAILMALIAAGVGPGDEVIVPNRTWIATAHAPYLLGAKVVLVDVIKGGLTLDVSQLEGKITQRTKAVIPVHLNGRSADMSAIKNICIPRGLTVIEDAAQAFCSRNSFGFLGTQSFAGCFSLSIAKLITSGQGGFVVTPDEETYKKLKSLRTHGIQDLINCSFDGFGFNFRFTDIQASIGLAQLKKLQKRIDSVLEIYAFYKRELKNPQIKFLDVKTEQGEIPIYIEVLCKDRGRLVEYLNEHRIQVRPFYPDLDTAAHLNNKSNFPNSRVFADQGVFLPCGPDQSLQNIQKTIFFLNHFDA